MLAILMAAALAIGPEKPVSPNFTYGMPGQIRPAVAGSLVVWREPVANAPAQLFAKRIVSSGITVQNVISESSDPEFPALAFAGSCYFAAWEEGNNLFLRRLALDGAPLDAPIAIADVGAEAAVAFDGRNILVVWTDSERILGARFTPDGVRLDPSPVVVATDTSTFGFTFPHVTWNGSEYLVAWQRGAVACPQAIPYCGVEKTRRDVFAARVNASGVLLDMAPITIAATPDDEALPTVASDGRDFLVAYQHNTGTELRRVSAAGDVSAAVVVSDDSQTSAIAYVNGEYVIAYGMNTLHAVFFDANSGTFLGDTILGDAGEIFPELAMSDSSPLLVYQRPVGDVRRLFTRAIGAPRVRRVRR